MIDGLKAAAALARRWAAIGRARLELPMGHGDDKEVTTALAALATRIQARGFEKLARALDAMAAAEDTDAVICPHCGSKRSP